MPDALLEVAEAEMARSMEAKIGRSITAIWLRAFAALPKEQRSVVLLIGVEDLSYQQAARVLGAPIGAVTRLSRGHERLRYYMNGTVDGRTAELR